MNYQRNKQFLGSYSLELFKKWTANQMDLPPLADEVYELQNISIGPKSNETQTLTIFINFHQDDNHKKKLIFVFQDDETILSVKRNLYDKKVNDSLDKIILYNKDLICDNLKTLKECKVVNNSILDAWLDSGMKIKIYVIVKQYASSIEYSLRVNAYISFKDFIDGVADLLLGKCSQGSLELMATAIFSEQKLEFSEKRSLYELGIKNGAQIKIIMHDKHGCFPPDAPVTMGNGSKRNISQVEVGDEVMSFDLKEKKLKTSKVVYLHHGNAAEFIWIKTESSLIKTKPNTPFLTQEGWKAIVPDQKLEIKQLSTKDLILDENLKFKKIISIQNIIEYQKVYNITLSAQSVFIMYGFVVLHNNFNAQVKINNQLEQLEITSGMMVHNIKGMIYMKHGIKIEEQEIYYNEKKLKDGDLVLEQTNSEYIQLQLKTKNQTQKIKNEDDNEELVLGENKKDQKMENINQHQQITQLKDESQLISTVQSEKKQQSQEIILEKLQDIKQQERIKLNLAEERQLRLRSIDQIVKIKDKGFSQKAPLSYPIEKIQDDTIAIKIVSNDKVVKIKIKQNLKFRQLCRIIHKYINIQNTERSSILYDKKMYEVANQNLNEEDLQLKNQTTLILLTENQILSAFQFTYYLSNQISLQNISELIESLKCLKKMNKVNLFIQNEIQKINNEKNKQNLYQQFQLHHLLAIKIQTSNLVYKELNIDLRSNQFHQWSGYLQCLMQATRYCKYYQGITFRGFKDYQNTEIYQEGKILQWSEISASTKDIKVAEQFTNCNGMIFETELISAKDIENLSIYESEKEVLILPFSCFAVKSVQKQYNQPIYVKLREVPLPRSSQILLWIDDNPENNYEYVKDLQKENQEISVVFCKSTQEAIDAIQKYRFMIYLDDSNLRIVTDMVRFEEGAWNYEAGIIFLKYLIYNLKYDYQVLVFCGDVKKAKQSCIKLMIIGNYLISNQEVVLKSFIRFQ